MELSSIFSVPVWMSEFPDFEEHQESFLTCVRNFRKNNPQGIEKSNIAGYQSPFTLQGEEELRSLFQYVCGMAIQAIQDLNFIESNIFLTQAWVNFNDSRECMNSEHVHGEVLSGVFYLKAPPNSGKLVIANPGMNSLWSGCQMVKEKNQFTGERMRIQPEEGSIILFPSYLPHSVETNSHDDERISISFNLIVLPKESFPMPTEV
jgi:uncharacterized protein (TIGR02466 family)